MMVNSTLSAKKYRELFKLRAEGKLDYMECTKRLFDILKPLYFRGVKILDVPCGVGHYYRKIKELGEVEYIGVDLDSEAVKLAKDVWTDDKNANFESSDATKINVEDNSVDIVVCYNLLLHLKDYKDVVKELFRVSKKYIIIRSLFDKYHSMNTMSVSEDYKKVYPDGRICYNTYSREDVMRFLNSLGKCKITFINDNIPIPKENLEKQQKILGVDSSEFAIGADKNNQDWKGLKLNYEVLFIEKF